MSQASTSAASKAPTATVSSVIAVFPDHESAENAIEMLNEEGFPMSKLSIVGRDFVVREKPIGFASPGYFAKEGASTGAFVGGLFGMLLGAAFLVLPGVGPMVIAGPLLGALLGGLEGAVAGAAVGALSGALIGWGVSREKALVYETEVKAGKFLLIARGTPEEIARAKVLLETSSPERLDVYSDAATAA
jgi:uncharacterized membrane protein